MIDEEELTPTMDKKNSRTASVPPKSSGGSDAKKTENGNGNKYNRFNKKRESTNVRQRPDNGSGRRPAPQKSRTSTDKRPRPRGVFNDRQREEVVDDEGAEYGSALQQGSRKGNLNHLLNFTYAPRDAFRGGGGHSYTGHAGYGGHNRGSRRGFKPKYNKEQFLQANCQFIVREGEDYSVHSADPDKLVDWDFIEQVRVSSSELPSCPICLYPPVAAKITRCGHIYCWPCVLHYLTLGEKSWRKCPICYEAIHKEHLKSVQTKCVPRYKTGDEITLHLMKKERGSTLALPKPYWTQTEGKPIAVDDELSCGSMNIIVASLAQVEKLIIEPEKTALECQLAGETEASETCFIESALVLLQERLIKLTGDKVTKKEVTDLMEPIVEDSPTKQIEESISPTKITNKDMVRYSSAFSDEEEEPEEIEELLPGEVTVQANTEESAIQEAWVSDESENTSPRADGNASAGMFELSPEAQSVPCTPDKGQTEFEEMIGVGNTMPVEEAVEYLEMPREAEEIKTKQQGSAGNKFYYFYQAHDGQHIYMHAVNVRCLVREYGSLENCPDTITASVVEIESIFMTEDLRRRLRYLSHLPLTCEFQVVELLLKPPVVSKDTLNFLADDIERRHRLRQRRTRDDKRRERKIQDEEDRKQGIFPELKIPLHSRSQFPVTLAGGEQGIGDQDSISTVSSPSSGTPLSSPTSLGLNVFASEFVPGGAAASPSSTGSWGSDSGGMSFAKMLKEGKVGSRVWPKAGKTEVSPNLPPESEKTGRRHPDSEDSDPEDKVPVPEFHSAFEDAIQQAFDNLSKDKAPGSSVSLETSTGVTASGKKKKVPTATLR